MDFGGKAHDSFLGDLGRVVNSLRAFKSRNFDTFLATDNPSQSDRMEELLSDRHGGGDVLPRFVVAPLHGGFTLETEGLFC